MMRLALAQAVQARELGEVPVGAVLLDADGQLLATGFNRTIADHDPTAHAEIVALRAAARAAQNYRLPGATRRRIRGHAEAEAERYADAIGLKAILRKLPTECSPSRS